MNGGQLPSVPKVQILFGEIVYWVTIGAAIICSIGPLVAMLDPGDNVVNPYFLFASIFAGKTAPEVWAQAAGGFPGGHFYFNHLTTGDGFTQFGLALGCSVALWGLVAVSFVYLLKERSVLYGVLSLWVAALVLLSAIGIVEMH